MMKEEPQGKIKICVLGMNQENFVGIVFGQDHRLPPHPHLRPEIRMEVGPHVQ